MRVKVQVDNNCILAFYNNESKNRHYRLYKHYINSDPYFRDLYELHGRIEPIFKTYESYSFLFDGYRRSVIFERNCFF